MKRLRLSLLLGITFVLGAIAGGGASIWAFNELLAKPNAISSAGLGVSSKVVILEAIRAADQERATSLLETYLDGDLIDLSIFPESRLDKPAISALIRAAEYREKYPHVSSEPIVTSQVLELLSKYKKGGAIRP